MPTIVTLVPRLALTLALYLAFVGPSTGATLGSNNSLGRDGTFFGSHGELSGYAKVIVWLQIAWGLWRCIVLLGSWIGLWVLSGLGCAGLCGPRYRWEETPSSLEPDEDSPLPYTREKRRETMVSVSGDAQAEPHAYNSRRHSRIAENRLSSITIADPRFSDRTGRRAFSDPDDHTLNWSWMERCRDRIWDTWEFCLTRSNTARHGGDHQQDAYWHAWRSAGAPIAGDTERTREMSEKHLQSGTGATLAVASANSRMTAMSPGLSSTLTAVGTPIPFSSLTTSTMSGLPAYQPGVGGYGQMDTMLSTLQEMSSNPSLAASSPPVGASPATVPQPLPIFSTPQAPRRGLLTQELFAGPLPETTSSPPKPDDGAWLGSSAVPLGGPPSGNPSPIPYPFPAYSSSQQHSPKTTLPFPLAPVVVANEQSVIQVPPASRHPANVFPTPAPTIHSLPFPAGASSSGMSPGRQPHEELVEYYDDAEHGVIAHMRSQIGSQGTGSMSSLGQPIQSRYPVGYRRPRGRRSSASASGSGVASSHRVSDASASALGSQQRSPRDSFISGSGSGSGYGSQAMVRSQRSRISGVSNGYVEGELYYAEEESLGSRISSPVGPGMAGVGAGGGLGPRGSLLNLGSQPPSPLDQYALDPPPSHPSGSRRRAGTLPSPSSSGFVPPPVVPPPGPVGSLRGRLASAPSPPSPSTREYFAPMPGQDIDMPTFAQAYGPDDDDEFDGSQEAAEREDSVGLLSQAPSRRSSASGLNLRSRASQISLHRRGNNSRPVSLTSPTHLSPGAVRSRTTSLIGRQAGESRESLHSGSRGSLAVPEARSRTGSDAGPSDRRTSQYSDARSRTHSGTGSHLEGSVESAGPGPGHDMTFGVQVDWQTPETLHTTEGDGEGSASGQRASSQPGRQDIASASRASPQVPGPSTRSRPIDINVPAGSRPDLSSADASFVTALPSVVASTTDTVGISEASSERTWERGRSRRYFMEGGAGAVGPR